MANTQESDTPVNKVPDHGDHDRVVMLSLHSDGTPAQVAPELIGDKDAALAAAKEQFKQQAVSAKDVELRGVRADADSERDDEVLKKEHDKAASAAEKAAEKTVDALHQGLGD
ncbi:MAG: hypothetical protein ACXVXO_00340 [Mycobacteriaceae bacterium]